ncbi:putative toxin [Janibacter massiliensis]|uniref:putative toxin n=1 Tax=Janibacter massiliensis TaxID=2058291 RepID=UPI000D103FA4
MPKNQPSRHSLAKGTHRNSTQCDSPPHTTDSTLIWEEPRIADGVTRDSITEIKNVKYQGLTRQIRDYLDYKGDKTFYLYVRSDTRLSGRLKEKIRDGSIKVRYIPNG